MRVSIIIFAGSWVLCVVVSVVSLLSVSHACARGQRGACVRREYPRSGAVRCAVRVCVRCVRYDACGGGRGDARAPLLALRDFGHSRGARDVHTHGARV